MRILLLLLLFCFEALGTIIPSDRRIIWQGNIGVPGGVPVRTVIFANVRNPPYNATGNGTTDDTAAIQAALNACPAGQVVYIPTGTYKVTSALVLKNSYTVRGDGPGLTVINGFCVGNEVIALGRPGSGALNSYNIFNYPPQGSFAGSPVSVTGGTSKDSTSITVTSTNNFTVGGLFNIDELNDTNGLGVIPVGSAGFQNTDGRTSDGLWVLGQVMYITAITNTTVYFDPPLVWWFTNANSALATPFPCVNKNAGVENLTVYNNNTGCDMMFSMTATAYCWLKNVETAWADGDHIYVDSCARCEVRDSYLHDGYLHGPGTHDTTLKIQGHASGTLVENNIFRRLHISMFFNASSGNVCGYNYSTNGFDQNCSDCMLADSTFHGAHSLMNLYEGNVVNSYEQDGIWGTSSHGTLLRNFISGQNFVCPPYTGRGPEQTNSYVRQLQYNTPVYLQGFANSRSFNVVGNVLGTPNMGNYTFRPPVYMLLAPAARITDVGAIFTLGYAFGNDGGGSPNESDIPFTTLINHGNWDIISQSQMFSNNISDHVIPQSYYLPVKPTFFGTMTWPAVDPSTGQTNFTLALIPAQYRYFYGSNPPSIFPPPINNPTTTAKGKSVVNGKAIMR